METPLILAIDDEQEMLVSYQKILKRAGFQVQTANSGSRALKLLEGNRQPALIICDLKMPGMDGMELLKQIKTLYPHLPVIMVTGYGTLELGVEAVKSGAFDFIEKPFSSKKLLQSIQKALSTIIPVEESGDRQNGFDGMVGKCPAMLKIFDIIHKVAPGNANIMITGESGTGKELIARSIHKRSIRRNFPLIPINCGALPDQLLESELFGYEKGAFTGAFQAKPGLVELANGGTLFLDEVCEMPLNSQVKLLRMLEDHKIRRIGGQEEISVNLRVVSATNRDLDEALQKGWLREDFYYRLNTIQIHVPPLRERLEDLPLLAQYFLDELNKKYNRQIQNFSPETLQVLKQYAWPGNVRELQNIVERTYYLATPPTIRVADLPIHITREENNCLETNWFNLSYREAKERILEDFEKKYLQYQLKAHHWNISKTAAACGIDRRTIHRLIKRFGLVRENDPL